MKYYLFVFIITTVWAVTLLISCRTAKSIPCPTHSYDSGYVKYIMDSPKKKIIYYNQLNSTNSKNYYESKKKTRSRTPGYLPYYNY